MNRTTLLKKIILGSALVFLLPNCGSQSKKNKNPKKNEEIKPNPVKKPTPTPKEDIVDDTNLSPTTPDVPATIGIDKLKFQPMFRYCVVFDGRPWYVCTRLSDADANGGKFGYIRPKPYAGAFESLFFRPFKNLTETQSRSCVWWYSLQNTKPTLCSIHTR